MVIWHWRLGILTVFSVKMSESEVLSSLVNDMSNNTVNVKKNGENRLASVVVGVGLTLFEALTKKLSWLCYEKLEDFNQEAIIQNFYNQLKKEPNDEPDIGQ